MSTQDRGNLRTALLLFGIVVATLIASLLAPAVYVPESRGYFGNNEMVLPGWTALMYAVIFPAVFYLWMPNVALTLGMILLLARRWRGAMVYGTIAFGLAFANWLIVVNFFGDPDTGFCKPLVGYYLWMVSMAELAVGSWYCGRNCTKKRARGVRAFLIGAMLGLVAGICAIVSLATAYARVAGATTDEWYVATLVAGALGALAGFVIGGIVNVTISKKVPDQYGRITGTGG
jgi:hypothetical protein